MSTLLTPIVERACGKPLWKTLWKLWKSIGFPQVFLGFENFTSQHPFGFLGA
jgi:hypothetical protein